MKTSVNNLADMFKALSDPTRLKILQLLLEYNSNLCVGMIANRLGITQPAVSQHLKILKSVGFLEAKRMGVHVHYKIKKETFIAFKEHIEEFVKLAFLENKEYKECNEDCKKNS